MLYEARLAQNMAADLLAEGIYVIGFFFPVVPREQARIRVQISAGHSTEQIDRCVDAFVRIGKKHGVLS
jgi:glycine C-acetyltransferase